MVHKSTSSIKSESESCRPDYEHIIPEEAAEEAALAQVIGVLVGEAAGAEVAAAAGAAVAAAPAQAVLPLLRHVPMSLLVYLSVVLSFSFELVTAVRWMREFYININITFKNFMAWVGRGNA